MVDYKFEVSIVISPVELTITANDDDKIYGEDDPTFGYCVYVNKTNSVFNLIENFMEVDFINTYFTNIYCTRDVFVEIKTDNLYSATSNAANGTHPYSYTE